jgi:hypothetical protein
LSGQDIPQRADAAASFADLTARRATTIDYHGAYTPAHIDGSEGRDIALTIAKQPVTLNGQAFLLNYAFPHFFFHVTTAYDILRHNGVEIGKRDYMGAI